MAASTQERLKLKQYQVDTWTTREQLCLASAVVRSGDQNWVAVRRNIKMLTNETSRPPDWYSTKNCALQYARLLERVDTPKRKRERCDGGNETPGEAVTKMLSKQRIEELQSLKAKEKTSYNQLRWEIEQLEGGKLDHHLDAFWEQLVKEQSEEEEEEQRQQQWLKEREEKITAIQQALKHQGPKVPQPPHKKKPKLQVGVCSGLAENRRGSGLSETSSELDSAVDSPDLNEVTSESLVSNKSQDESCGADNEVKPTPTSPLLSSLLSKSPITGLPMAASSPLTQLGVGNRPMRGVGISPVSQALQNLVSSAISGTSASSSDKDKTTPSAAAAASSTTTGTSTLSLLLDLPPSTPGGPLPRLSDLPGQPFEQRDSEKKSAQKSKSDKSEQSCTENNGCGEQEKTQPVTTSAAAASSNPTDKTDGTDLEEDEDVTSIEVKDDNKQEERKEAATGSPEESENDEKDSSVSQTSCQTSEGNVSKKESRTSHKEEKETCEQSEKDVKTDHKHQDEKKEETEVQVQSKTNKEAQQPVKLEETKTEVKDDLDSMKETSETTKKDEDEVEEKEVKIEEQKQVQCSSVGKDEAKSETTLLSKVRENVSTIVSSEVEKGDCSINCRSEEKNCCLKEETDYEKTEDDKEVGTKKEKKAVGKCSDVEGEVKVEEEVKKKDEEEEQEQVTTEGKEGEGIKKTDNKQKEEESYAINKSVSEDEEPLSKMSKTEDVALSFEGEKKTKKMAMKKEQDEDHLESQDSRDGVSEDDGSTVGSRKRKISVGDILGSSSPLISESAPNSPASTHYGDDSENERAYRSWKKPIMILWNDIAAHKCASLFLRPITDDHAPGYHSIVYRPMDLQKIKRKIESGAIRTTAEFQRDIMLMFLNATMYNTRDHNVYHMAHQMMKDAVSTIQDFLTTQMLMRAEETPQKSLRRETRESSSKRSDEDSKRKRDPLDEKTLKKRRIN